MSTKNNMPTAWRYYEQGRAYNNSLVPNQYDLVNTNIEFFIGNQWTHLPETRATAKLAKPVFNIIKRITSLFIASITSSAVTISFDPLTYYDGENIADPETNAATYATAEVQNLLEKFKIKYRIREALFDGAQTGDYCAHFYWDPDAMPYGGAFGPYRGELQMELVDGINVMFGNPNNDDVQSQPYILIVGRDSVDNLRAEMERCRKDKTKSKSAKDTKEAEEDILYAYASPTDPDLIIPDRDINWQAGIGGRTELNPSDDTTGKALYVYMYSKKTHEEDVIDPATGEPMMEPELNDDGEPVYETDSDGAPILGMDGKRVPKMRKARRLVTSVHVTKATKSAVIYEDVDTGLSLYPIAWGNWEKQKNQYHGRALVTGILPNQIFINTMFALVMQHLQLQSFPKTIYNADLIGQWNNEVGRAIGVHDLQPGQSIEQVAYSMRPADMSAQIIQCIDKAVELTRDCLGATDAQMGHVRADNTSALMVLQTASEVPLENTRAGLYEWIEQIGRILLDMMGTYYHKRPLVRDRAFSEVVTDPATGQPKIDPTTGQLMTKNVTHRVAEDFDFSQFKNLWLNIRVDVGASTQFSEIAMVQTLDNLRRDGTLDVINYLERIPDKLIPRKADLISDLKERMAQEAQEAQAQQAANTATVNAPEGGPGIPGSSSMLRPMSGTNNSNVVAGKAKPNGNSPGLLDTAPQLLDAGYNKGNFSNAAAVANMPGATQARYGELPRVVQKALVRARGQLQ